MAQDKAVNTEKYQGIGKFTGAAGGLFTAGAVSRALLPFAGVHIDRFGLTITKNKTFGMVALVSAGIFEVAAAVVGWKVAANGKKQFEALKSEMAAKDGFISGLQT